MKQIIFNMLVLLYFAGALFILLYAMALPFMIDQVSAGRIFITYFLALTITATLSKVIDWIWATSKSFNQKKVNP